MKLFVAYIFAFLFVFNTNASDFAKKNHGNHIEDAIQYKSSLNHSNLIVSNHHKHNEPIFAIDIEEEEDNESKWLLTATFVTHTYFNSCSVIDTSNSLYSQSIITPSISKFILLEIFRI